MKTERLKWMKALLALTLTLRLGHASAATLTVGDPAPKLQVSKWVQGEPVKEFARDKVYLVEFWATWCGPCLESIPHVNALHQKFKDKGLVVIGQDVLEEDPQLVPPFVQKMRNSMSYRVALDTEDRAMETTWMAAAEQKGIPVAFVVDQRGIIAWIGHPLELKEPVIEQVLAGTFDIPKAAAEFARQREMEEQIQTLMQEFNRLVRDQKWDDAEAVLVDAEKVWPQDQRHRLEMRRFHLLLDRRDYSRAYKVATQLSDARPEDAMMQNSLAWTIATKDGLAERDLNLAEKIARRGLAAVKDSDFDKAEILDTLARVLFLKGETKPAIEVQGKAVQFATGDRKSQFQNNLEDYKAGRAPNEARLLALKEEINRGLQKGDWDKAESALAQLEKASSHGSRVPFDSYRFKILVGRGDYDGAAKIADRLAQATEGEAMRLNDLAWSIASREGATKRELDLAERIARHANKVTKGSNAEILDTLARVLFLNGDKAVAIEAQQKAVSFARGRRKVQFQGTLDEYQAGKLPKAY
jgi:thiol-disulfide isomerase/thioredoxin/tetratricopeptide (TPR) repeat protein